MKKQKRFNPTDFKNELSKIFDLDSFGSGPSFEDVINPDNILTIKRTK